MLGWDERRRIWKDGLVVGLGMLALLMSAPASVSARAGGRSVEPPLDKPRCCFRLRLDAEGFYLIDYGEDKTREKIGSYGVFWQWHTYSIVSFHDSPTQYSSLVGVDAAEAAIFDEEVDVDQRTASGGFVPETGCHPASRHTGKGTRARLARVSTAQGGTGSMLIKGRTASGGDPDFYGWGPACGSEATFASAAGLRGPFWDFDIPAPPLDLLRAGKPNGIRTICTQSKDKISKGIEFQDYYAVEAKLTYFPESQLKATKAWLGNLVGDDPGFPKDFPYQHAVLEKPLKTRCHPLVP